MPQEGEQAIGFTLEASNGEKVSLSDYRGKNVVLYFYPKDNTPGCTVEACGFRDHHQEFADLNTVILGVSRDSVASHQKFVEKQNLPFLLLSDPDGKVCEAYGVLKDKNMFGKKFKGIERSTFVINGEGQIVKVYRKVKAMGHVKEVLQYIKEHLR
ncbi:MULTISPECIES: thioredoxin-dependent thiol peroxidase [Thermoactinomyces]|jgi:thioredoxin-dependent peroxiredoxin|uniref:thioredoxin-dependent peroxiredoxin n=1 Tax=Thermoactinomyces daqus TaxID=1329516 RepID=A0A7W1XB73_9BACL|nr:MULTISPECIES: thioredoxin-dependent thiol peroxidase [Thermoactinomyces]MBA4543409.1 thioredoxin-dependent thiol peroxidase [Thermoactinomyces daqus]MBH8599437.1 thioredoxin-dependent thiol peroxidase [Thermoactinomyces sp. CICC 10523]MBH8608192.1 thioredoxin-dependent thiol peroxidase [Thermoactinomyces sp. CICC 10521]